MSVPFGRSVVIPASFIACAIAVTFGPAVNVSFSLLLVVLGLAVSTMVYVLWPEPPVAVALVAEPRHRPARLNRQPVSPAPSATF